MNPDQMPTGEYAEGDLTKASAQMVLAMEPYERDAAVRSAHHHQQAILKAAEVMWMYSDGSPVAKAAKDLITKTSFGFEREVCDLAKRLTAEVS